MTGDVLGTVAFLGGERVWKNFNQTVVAPFFSDSRFSNVSLSERKTWDIIHIK